MMASMTNMNQSTMRALAFLVLAVAIVIGGYTYQNSRDAALGKANTTLETASTSNAVFAPVVSAKADGGGSTNIIPIANTSNSIKIPDYTRALTFSSSANLSPEAKAALQKSYAKQQAVLKKDQMQFNEWIFLGNDNLIAGNYRMAEEYWQYASLRWPTNVASFNALGDLYMGYLKDYPKAEKNFLQAIKNKPDDTNPYRNLFTMYSETSYKPTNNAAEDILKKAIAANPRAVDMQYLLAQYYKKLGRKDEAQAMFTAAEDNATAQSQTGLAAQIKLDAAK